MIYEDGLGVVATHEVRGDNLQAASIGFYDKQTFNDFRSDYVLNLRLNMFVGNIMDAVDKIGNGHARLDCIEVSRGKVEGLIIAEPYYYYKYIGNIHPTKHMMKNLMGDYGLFKLCERGHGGSNCDSIRFYMSFNRERTETKLDCVMRDGWRF